jgi:hypothetical protein
VRDEYHIARYAGIRYNFDKFKLQRSLWTVYRGKFALFALYLQAEIILMYHPAAVLIRNEAVYTEK